MLRVTNLPCPLLTQGGLVGIIRASSMSQTAYSRRALDYVLRFSLRDKPVRSAGEWMQWT